MRRPAIERMSAVSMWTSAIEPHPVQHLDQRHFTLNGNRSTIQAWVRSYSSSRSRDVPWTFPVALGIFRRGRQGFCYAPFQHVPFVHAAIC